jgi:hypothetical protein
MPTPTRRVLAVTKAVELLHKMLGADADYMVFVRDPRTGDKTDSVARMRGDPRWIAATLQMALQQYEDYASAVLEAESETLQ